MLVIGHRGAAGHAPENTLAALEKGIALGVDFVEFDVQRTIDGALVLFHDRRLERLTQERGLLSDLPLRAVRRLRLADGQSIPLLDEALQHINGRAGAMIELKGEGLAAEVCRVVEATGFHGPTMYASFWHRELLAVRRINRSAETMALLAGMPAHPTAWALDAQATSVGLALECLSAETVRALHAQRLKVVVYTVDDPSDIQWVKTLGVDGIVSNYPDRVDPRRASH